MVSASNFEMKKAYIQRATMGKFRNLIQIFSNYEETRCQIIITIKIFTFFFGEKGIVMNRRDSTFPVLNF